MSCVPERTEESAFPPIEQGGGKIRALQANLGRSKEAEELLMQTATAKGEEVDLLFANELPKHSNRWIADKTHKAGIAKCNRRMKILKQDTNNEGFVWIEIGNVRYYSCYFSPNETKEEFSRKLGMLATNIRSAKKDVIVTGDFNAKSP